MIYFAGPLFNEAERNFNKSIVEFLRENGLEVWLPQENQDDPSDSRDYNQRKKVFLREI